MDIKISNNWLREYLSTKASPKEIADYISLCGPSIEKITKDGKDYIYDIEVTTNRVDCMSIVGIAREAGVILPQFGVKALFKNELNSKTRNTNNKNLLKIKVDPNVKRVMAVVMEVSVGATPLWMKKRLEISGMRSLNPIVDITNYVMLETGHPTHVFDFDKIKDNEIIFRLSKKGEEITTFDNKTYTLEGDDIVIDNGKGEIIDLPGIIGLKNSVVDNNTKRIVFFIDNNNPDKIRRTSTRLGIRTMAAILNEKGVDPELAPFALAKGVELYKEICKGKIISKTYDLYLNTFNSKQIKIEHSFIEKILGVAISPSKVTEILEKLGFKVNLDKKKLLYLVKVPSWRINDVQIKEDLVEEVARIYGYHNLPSIVMDGVLPEPITSSPFKFENKIKNILKGYGGIEVYTNSLVPKDFVEKNAISLKNPLGVDTKYMRTSLKPSLIKAALENNGEKDPFYLFEVANIYIPVKGDLPKEKMMLGIVFSNYDYRSAKGIIDALFEELNISNLSSKLETLGSIIYFEKEIETLIANYKEFAKYVDIPKYPAQVEDITLIFPVHTRIGDVIKEIQKSESNVSKVELKEIFHDSYTFRIWYQNKNKTLKDKEVEKIREKILKNIRKQFGGTIKN